MDVSRRGFFKLSGLSIAALAAGLGFDPAVAEAKGYALKLEGTKRFRASATSVPVGVECYCM